MACPQEARSGSDWTGSTLAGGAGPPAPAGGFLLWTVGSRAFSHQEARSGSDWTGATLAGGAGPPAPAGGFLLWAVGSGRRHHQEARSGSDWTENTGNHYGVFVYITSVG
jgi:hypothetical protein